MARGSLQDDTKSSISSSNLAGLGLATWTVQVPLAAVVILVTVFVRRFLRAKRLRKQLVAFTGPAFEKGSSDDKSHQNSRGSVFTERNFMIPGNFYTVAVGARKNEHEKSEEEQQDKKQGGPICNLRDLASCSAEDLLPNLHRVAQKPDHCILRIKDKTKFVRPGLILRASNPHLLEPGSRDRLLEEASERGLGADGFSAIDIVDMRHRMEKRHDSTLRFVPEPKRISPNLGSGAAAAKERWGSIAPAVNSKRWLPITVHNIPLFPSPLNCIESPYILLRMCCYAFCCRKSKLKALANKEIFDFLRPGGMRLLYVTFLEFDKSRIYRILRLCTLAPLDNPVLFHCVSGKDRTGLIAALLLTALGVSREDVINHHQLSSSLLPEDMVKTMSQNIGDIVGDAEAVKQLAIGSPPGVMRTTFEYLDYAYGSVDGYLDAIGFDESLREALREKMLVEVEPAK